MSTTEPGLNGHDQTHRGRFALPLAPMSTEPRSKRRLGLALQPLAGVATFAEGDPLEAKEFKRVSDVFTPHLPGTVQCLGMVSKPKGSYETRFQILAGDLLQDPKVASQAVLLAFTPVFDWARHRVALMTTPLVDNRRPMFDRLRCLAAVEPFLMAYLVWDPQIKKYVLGHVPLSPVERSVVEAVTWPDGEAVEEALSPLAVDTLDQLLADNPEFALRFRAKEER